MNPPYFDISNGLKRSKIDKFRAKITLKLAQIDALDDLLDLYLSGKSEMKI